ncbi:MAG: YhbY family RNA-binding protein [Ruminococcaceae bacterium]|nr:YhbY family RNA-binding protein [Oscillospiraceae bacterium]
MLNSKQRAYLKGLASAADTIIYIGKDGINSQIVSETAAALKARELIKGKVQENSPVTAKEACERLAIDCKAEAIQTIGSKFVLYKRNETAPKIVLPKAAKK